MSSRHELPVDRLATSDVEGNRIWLYQSDVSGKFSRRRTWVHGVLILIFLLMPWLRIGGHQAVLLDIPDRKFNLLGLRLWAHDAPLLLFVLAGAAVLLAFSTAVWGRVWCGWACPQTVFLDSFFRRIERWIEGDAFERRRLDSQAWNGKKAIKKSVKWVLFALITLMISHSFLAYFVGTEELAVMVRRSPAENPLSFVIMAVVTGFLLFDFGWFREQFCTLVCPYGRFQSVLMDENSLIVAYDSRRGEPRRGSVPAGQAQGDCVNCYRCVQVCPTGVDIRRGLQLECVACASCVDACNAVMWKLGKPEGLIRYTTAAALKDPGRAKGLGAKVSARVWIYGTILALLGSGLAFTLASRKTLDMTWVRYHGSPYEMVPSGNKEKVLNHFKIDFTNQGSDNLEVRLAPVASQSGLGIELVTPMMPIPIRSGGTLWIDLFVKFPKELLKSGHGQLLLEVTATGLHKTERIPLVGPEL